MKIVNLSLSLFLLSFSVIAQTGGTFDLSHNVIAGGGSRGVGGQFTVEGTTGQNLAGTLSGGGSYRLRGGFWAFEALAPTAAAVSISGQIRTAHGSGITSVRLVLLNIATGETFHAISSSFGHYRFDEITVGQTYILTIIAKRFVFEPNTRIFTLLDELTDENFIALPEQ
jgi:hypothetical protein